MAFRRFFRQPPRLPVAQMRLPRVPLRLVRFRAIGASYTPLLQPALARSITGRLFTSSIQRLAGPPRNPSRLSSFHTYATPMADFGDSSTDVTRGDPSGGIYFD